MENLFSKMEKYRDKKKVKMTDENNNYFST